MNASRDRLLPILMTLAAAMALTIVPLPDWLESWRPNWVALVLIFWGLETRDFISVGAAFLVGLVLDLLTGSLLGMHALEMVVLVYLVIRFRARLRFFPPWQQALSVLALLINDRIIVLWIVSLKGDEFPTAGFWLPPLVSMLLWPWIFLLLDRYRGSTRHRAAP